MHHLIQETCDKKLDELWNEHDGTHFYKDEFKDFLKSFARSLIEKEIKYLGSMKGSVMGDGNGLIGEKVYPNAFIMGYNSALQNRIEQLKMTLQTIFEPSTRTDEEGK